MPTSVVSFSVADDNGFLGVITWIPTKETLEKLEKLVGENRDNAEAAIHDRLSHAMRQAVGTINALADPD